MPMGWLRLCLTPLVLMDPVGRFSLSIFLQFSDEVHLSPSSENWIPSLLPLLLETS